MHRLMTSIACFALALPALAEFPLTLKVEGTTAGIIVGPQCACPPVCAQSVGSNQLVTPTARSVSSTSLGWEKGSGAAKACSDTKADCSFTMTEPASITARFGAGIPLTVTRIGELGSAHNLQSSVFPVEIQCPPDREGTFAAGSQVERRSEPTLVLGQAGLAFLGRQGHRHGALGRCPARRGRLPT